MPFTPFNMNKITYTKSLIVKTLSGILLSFFAVAVMANAVPHLNPAIKPVPVFPSDQTLYRQYPNAVLYYYGVTGSDALIHMMAGNFHRWPEHIQSLEFDHTLSECNFLSRLVNPLVGLVQLAGNVTIRQGSNEHTIYELNPFLLFRWANLPWNHYINTSLGLGEGISYDTSVSSIEKKDNDNTKRLLNYLMFEATFALPSYPKLQLVARIHHRSGAYGLYHAGNGSTNDAGLAVRFLFD